jgi:(E)-4-hydroxy-3-methylbut-2-enyl-diphosphate synthase
MEIRRRLTKVVSIGNVRIGGNNPISIQSMTKTDTRDIRQTVSQIKELEGAGCEIVRVAVKDKDAALGLRKIKDRISIPLEADIHFDYCLALEAIENGADAIRLNPGNINKPSQIKLVVKKSKDYNIPIRVGVNSGSLNLGDRCLVFGVRGNQRPKTKDQKPNISGLMVRSALEFIRLLERLDFSDIIISLKSSDVLTTIEAYRKMAKLCDYPFHLGITATGLPHSGAVKSAIGIGSLLSEGIGDTIRVSLTGEPKEEVNVAKQILSSLGLRKFGSEIISCPTCGRCEVDLVGIVKDLDEKLSTINYQLSTRPLKVAVMGCVVNGPGEVKDADIGIACGKGVGLVFKKGRAIRKVREEKLVETLLSELRSYK